MSRRLCSVVAGRCLAYHQTTKHAPNRYACSMGYMDWGTQPDPFRRYTGAPLTLLDEIPPDGDPPGTLSSGPMQLVWR